VRAELQRYLDGAELPDAGLLPKDSLPVVCSDITVSVAQQQQPAVITAAALPGAKRFVLRPRAELQAQADKADANVAYISFGVELAGDEADVDFGVDILLPTQSKAVKLCCCSSSDHFSRKQGTWKFVSRGTTMCG